MATNVGWRNFWWFNVAINIFVFLTVLFLFPETKWPRGEMGEVYSKTQLPSNLSGELTTEVATGTVDTESPNTMISGSDEKLEASAVITVAVDEHLGKGKPGRGQWRFFQPAKHPLQSLGYEFILPWKLFLFPIVQFASFVISFSSTSYLMITLVQSRAFGGKPYLFNSQSVGFTNFASLVGGFIGLFTAGPASDMISAFLTKRNNGIREPEMRLVTMVPYILIMMLANFIIGFGLQHSWDWRVG